MDGTFRRRAYHLMNLGLIVAMAWQYRSAWDRLPLRIPTHFNWSGQPDGWMDKGWGFIAASVGAPLLVILICYGTAGLVPWLRRHPRWLNMPHKERFLALPDQVQDRVWNGLRELLYASSAMTTLLFAAIARDTVMIGLEESHRLDTSFSMAIVALLLVVETGYIVWLMRLVGRLVRQGDSP